MRQPSQSSTNKNVDRLFYSFVLIADLWFPLSLCKELRSSVLNLTFPLISIPLYSSK